jgi:dolichyl-phosphate-mannose--protein O-mannosyl transferase
MQGNSHKSLKKFFNLLFFDYFVCITELSVQKFPCHSLAQFIACLKVPFRIASNLFFQEFSLTTGPVPDQAFGHLKMELESES